MVWKNVGKLALSLWCLNVAFNLASFLYTLTNNELDTLRNEHKKIRKEISHLEHFTDNYSPWIYPETLTLMENYTGKLRGDLEGINQEIRPYDEKIIKCGNRVITFVNLEFPFDTTAYLFRNDGGMQQK